MPTPTTCRSDSGDPYVPPSVKTEDALATGRGGLKLQSVFDKTRVAVGTVDPARFWPGAQEG